MNFLVAWPDGTRTSLKIESMKQLDNFVGDLFSQGADVDLLPTDEGLMLFIDDPKWVATEPLRKSA